MKRTIDWIKTHKLVLLLGVVIAYFIIRDNAGIVFPTRYYGGVTSKSMIGESAGAPATINAVGLEQPIVPNAVPATDQANRLVIKETTMSLVVQDVVSAIKSIQEKSESLGGYLVESHVSKPEESASGSISIRVPEEKLFDALDAFRKASIRVVDEQVSGQDVTDQYVDVDARLATLNKTKAKFEEILDRATQIQDLLNVQRELVNLQAQIDSVKGQQQFLSQSAKLSKITVYLSTDEFSLPYSPKEAWRPGVVFKLAVRSLVTNLRNVGTTLIWIGVYSPVWGTLLIVFWVVKKKKLI